MPKRSRAEKLAGYSPASKRGYRARKQFLAQMKTAQPGEVEPLNDDPGRIVANRAVDAAGLGYAAQDRDKRKCNLAESEQSVNRVFHPLS